MRIAHLTISHGPFDVRIFQKEARTLAAAGHEVHVMTPGPAPAFAHGIHLHVLPDVGGPSAYFWRVWRRAPSILRAAKAVDADVYHLPDPALIPVALLLQRRGAKIVYDAHEDRPRQARTKYRAEGRPIVGAVSSLLWRVLEAVGKRRFDGFAAVTPTIAATYPPGKTVVLANYPQLGEFASLRPTPYDERPNDILYCGSLNRFRSIHRAVEAIGLVAPELGARLVLIGGFKRAHPGYQEELERLDGSGRVVFAGHKPRAEVVEALGRARVGLTMLSARPEHVDAMGNKTFEYMAAGLPVIAPDFPVWREVVADIGAGLVADSEDPAALAAAMEALLRDPERAQAMGRRGAEAVATTYNWQSEGAKLTALYEGLAVSRVRSGRVGSSGAPPDAASAVRGVGGAPDPRARGGARR